MPEPARAKRFSWSWSRLKNWRTCPKRHYHVDLQKEFKDDSEQLRWGERVHSSFAANISKGSPLPIEMQNYGGWARAAADFKSPWVEVKVENKLAINADFQPVSFFDGSAWFRSVVDVAILAPTVKTAITLDWKTGKVQPEYEQLALSAETVFAHFPKIEQIGAIYVWLGYDAHTVERYQRGKMQEVWNKVLPDVKKMEDAARTMTYPPKPSGICVSYCPVTSCPHHGRGTR